MGHDIQWNDAKKRGSAHKVKQILDGGKSLLKVEVHHILVGMKNLKQLLISIQILTFLVNPYSVQAADNLKLEDIALPSDFKDLPKTTGAIYYSSSSKNKVLVPVHLWGHLVKPGLHFIPSDTTFIKGLSSTGGPLPGAKLDEILLTRIVDGKVKKFTFDLSEGGDEKSQNFTVKSGDVVFVRQDRFFENRSYYTSLIGIAISVLSGILIYDQIQKR